jgi:type II secretory pathway pseudopilin PulG
MAISGCKSDQPEKLPSPAPRRQGADGFGLLEVLVATTLMGLVMVVLLQVLMTVLRCQETSWSHTQAILEGEKVLQENFQLVSLTEGTYRGQDGHFKYVVTVTPQFELSDPVAGKRILCSIIQVTVTWQERGKPMALTLQTIKTGVQKS